MDRNRNGGVKDDGQPRGMWAYLDGNDMAPQRMDRRSAAPQGCCPDSAPPVVVVTPFMEK